MNERELLTIDEVAEWLQVPVTTLYQWRLHGRGPVGMKIGRHIRYTRPNVDEWLGVQAAIDEAKAAGKRRKITEREMSERASAGG